MKPPRIRRLETTPSTNDDVKRAAASGEAEGLVVHALQQSAGRGRHGRTWQSPEGNLYCSVLLRPADGPASFAFYSFVAALALCDTVREFLPDAAVTLKWPNDVLVAGKKISGILLEAGEDYLVLGMGLNVLHHPEDVLYPATSLSAHSTSFQKICGANLSGTQLASLPDACLEQSASGAADWVPDKFSFTPHSRGEEKIFRNDVERLDAILETLLTRLWHWCKMLRAEGFAPIRIAWLENAQKTRMNVKLPDGAVEGEFLDIDDQGRLRLRLLDGSEKTIATGDVFFAG